MRPLFLLLLSSLLLLPLAGAASAQGGNGLDLNSASSEELQRLPGIGPVRADAIIRERETNGPFRTPDDLQRVSGIGPGILAQLCHLVRVGEERGCPPSDPMLPGSESAESGAPATPVNINLATEAELMVLPRIGPTRAAAMLQARESGGPFTSVEDLERVSGIGPATVEGLRPWVATRENLNTTTAERLQRVPGIGPELASEIIDERDAMGGFVAVESLLGIEGIAPSDLDRLRSWLEVREVSAQSSGR